jgi:acid phosphatase family membrane protein YuiD
MNITIANSVILLAISSISTVVFVQIFKTVLNSILIGKIDFKTLFSDGDFPSSHTAVLVSFNIVFWNLVYSYSIKNPSTDMFASFLAGTILTLWSCYEIRDAMGIRLRVQEHAKIIQILGLSSKDLSGKLEKFKLIDNDTNSQALQEELDDLLSNIKLKAGHLPHEVMGGIVTGGFIGYIIIFIANNNFKMLKISFTLFILYILSTLFIFNRKRMKMKLKFNTETNEKEEIIDVKD